MNIERLVAMANDIGNFFVTEAGPDDAPAQVATHLRRFWEPRMRAQIARHAAAGGQGLSVVALAAVRRLIPATTDLPRD